MTVHDLCDLLTPHAEREDMGTHLLTLYSIARFLPARRMLEIGVYDGTSTRCFLLAAMEIGGHLDSVDIAPCVETRQQIAALGMDSAWTFHHSSSAAYAACVPMHSLDLIFIDGDHTLSGVTTDWLLYSPKVRPGGLILLHDALLQPEPHTGVGQVIDTHIRPQWQRWECATLPYGWGLTIVRSRIE